MVPPEKTKVVLARVIVPGSQTHRGPWLGSLPPEDHIPSVSGAAAEQGH